MYLVSITSILIQEYSYIIPVVVLHISPLLQCTCVFFRSFYPSTSSTSSVRCRFFLLERYIQALRSQNRDTENAFRGHKKLLIRISYV